MYCRVPILNYTQTFVVKEAPLPNDYRSLGLKSELVSLNSIPE